MFLRNKFVAQVLSIGVLLIVGCNGTNQKSLDSMVQWHYDDLRAIDPVDSDASNMDIIALYIHEGRGNLNIRLDLLESSLTDLPDIYIGLDFKPAGSGIYIFDESTQSKIQWDAVLEFPAVGEINGYNPQGQVIAGIKARILRDTELDTIFISIDERKLLSHRSPINVEVLMVDPSSGRVIDRLHPVNTRSIPPNPAQVVIEFWNTFIPYTPAQALRMWDGAHSGPASNRHGLRYLLEAAEDAGVSISICDLYSPHSVSGLNYLGVFQDVMGLVQEGIIGVGCCSCLGISNGYTQFNQTDDFLSLEVRKQFVNAAINDEILLIEVDFSKSVWGVPRFADNAMKYIKNHPWIIPVKTSDLDKSVVGANIGTSNQALPATANTTAHEKYKREFFRTPDNILRNLAWQTYMTIISPANPEGELILDNYYGQLGHILSAAAWYADPYATSTCEDDLDWDGQNECVLSSEELFLTFELRGGFLAFAFYDEGESVHQITAPMSEVVIGLGDPSTYDNSKDVFADPALIPGTLAIVDESEYIYNHQTGKDFIEFFNENLGIRKTFRITVDSIKIEWSSTQAIGYFIPLAIDPWLRHEMEWSDRYFIQPAGDGWIFGIHDGLKLLINSSVQAQFSTFLDSKMFMGNPEDPNFEYPYGHYLPFPFAVLNVVPSGHAQIEVNILDP